MKVGEFEVDIKRKKIKNMHLSVYPPEGRVHLSVPEHLSDWDISTFLFSKLGWIRKQFKEIGAQPRQSEREFVTGESHYLFGNRYLLQIIPDMHSGIKLTTSFMELHESKKQTRIERASMLFTFYKNELSAELDKLMTRWLPEICPLLGGIKWEIDMVLRKWGQCYQSQKRVVYSLLLARVPRRCIEYVVVHELAHFHVREHDDKFTTLLDTYLPDWKARKQELDNFIALALPEK